MKPVEVFTIKINQLKTIIAIEQAGSITAAAEVLHISVPAIIKSIKNLEGEFGVDLIDRSGYRASLNQYGEYLALHAHGIIHATEKAKLGLNDLINKQDKQLLVAISASLLSDKVLKIVDRVRKFIPDATIHFGTHAVGLRHDNVPDFLKGEHDIFLSPVVLDTDLRGIDYEPLTRTTLKIVASKNHPALKLDKPALGDLVDYDWIIPSMTGEEFSPIKQLFLDHGATLPRSVFAMPVRHLVLKMLKNGEYIAIIACNDELYNTNAQDIETIDIDCSNYGWTNFILQREVGYKNELHLTFIRELKALLAPQNDVPPQ